MMKRVAEGWHRFVDLTVVPAVLPAVEKGLVPEALIRAGIRSMLRDLIAEFDARGAEGRVRLPCVVVWGGDGDVG